MEFHKDWFERWAGYAPIKTAVSDADSGESLTYQQLNNLSNYLAQQLEKKGLQPGDRLAVLSEYRLEYIVLLGVAMKLGIILVPLNYRLSSGELAYMINNCEPCVILSEQKYEHLIDKDQISCQVDHYLSMNTLSHDLNKQGSEFDFTAKSLPDDHPLFIIYTSGTTGFPKGAIYTYRMAFWNAVNTQARLDITAGDHTVICMPPFHTAGWNVLMIPFLLQGGSFTLLRKFDASRVMQLLEDEEASLFMGVPTILRMMAEAPEFSQVTLENLRYFIVGGEAMPLPLIQLWEQKGIPVRQGFGLTEVGPNVFSLHHDDAIRKIGSIGTPNFFLDVKLMKQDGTEAGVEEEGELWLKGAVATPGYWNNEQATQDAFSDGWFKTGDVLIQDSEGYYFVKDRIKNMFISGGENVYPAEIERCLQTHEAVSEVAVMGVADQKWGEVGKAFIVAADSSLSEQDIVDFCQGRLARYKIPKHIVFVTDIAKTESGKIDRKKLAGMTHNQ
ncbi:MAG: AMP-binding protein [Bacteroidota bacterium]